MGRRKRFWRLLVAVAATVAAAGCAQMINAV